MELLGWITNVAEKTPNIDLCKLDLQELQFHTGDAQGLSSFPGLARLAAVS